MSDIFEAASRKRIRFQSPNGLLTVEDLWRLPLKGNPSQANLDDITKQVFDHLESLGTTRSFVDDVETTTSVDAENSQIAFDILKRVIEVKKAEAAELTRKRDQKELEQRLLQIKHNRANASLENLSDEDLDKMLASCK